MLAFLLTPIVSWLTTTILTYIFVNKSEECFNNLKKVVQLLTDINYKRRFGMNKSRVLNPKEYLFRNKSIWNSIETKNFFKGYWLGIKRTLVILGGNIMIKALKGKELASYGILDYALLTLPIQLGCLYGLRKCVKVMQWGKDNGAKIYPIIPAIAATIAAIGLSAVYIGLEVVKYAVVAALTVCLSPVVLLIHGLKKLFGSKPEMTSKIVPKSQINNSYKNIPILPSNSKNRVINAPAGLHKTKISFFNKQHSHRQPVFGCTNGSEPIEYIRKPF